jgi:hypothetical protein
MSMTIGMNSMLNGQWIPIIAYLIGGSLGTYFGLRKEIKAKENIDPNKIIYGK